MKNQKNVIACSVMMAPAVAALMSLPAFATGTVNEANSPAVDFKVGAIEMEISTQNAHLSNATASMSCTFIGPNDQHEEPKLSLPMKLQNLTHDGYSSPNQKYRISIGGGELKKNYPGLKVIFCSYGVSFGGNNLPTELDATSGFGFTGTSSPDATTTQLGWIPIGDLLSDKKLSEKMAEKLAQPIKLEISTDSSGSGAAQVLSPAIKMADAASLRKYLTDLALNNELASAQGDAAAAAEIKASFSIYLDGNMSEYCHLSVDRKAMNCDYSYLADRWNGTVSAQFKVVDHKLTELTSVYFGGNM